MRVGDVAGDVLVGTRDGDGTIALGDRDVAVVRLAEDGSSAGVTTG
ncbi:hypothetical protein ACFQX7_26565 [Luedemannella flava]